MGFFLLGRGPNDDLVLLSDVAHATKSAAMAELSRLTADSSFAHWDAEVFVVDMDAAMPVLLVRPAAAEKEEAPDAVEAEFEESAATIESPEVEAVVSVGPAEAVTAEETAAEIDEALVVEEPIADAVLADAEEAEEPEEAEGTGGTLKDALMRTAAQMESEGIVAPESVGPAEETTAEETASDEQIAAEADTAAEESAEQPGAPGEASWPWDVAQESDAASTGGFSLSALEEPAVDVEGGMLRAGIDDETFAAAKPVILGAYGNEDVPSVDTELPVESAEVPVPEPEAVPEIAAEPETTPAPEAAPEPETVPEPETAPEPEPDDEVDEISDFIFDLEASIVESAPGGEAVVQGEEGLTQAPEAVAEVVAGMSCEDCVYVATCPNKDQRDPATCGSFQWK
jgi:hypothetical protein